MQEYNQFIYALQHKYPDTDAWHDSNLDHFGRYDSDSWTICDYHDGWIDKNNARKALSVIQKKFSDLTFRVVEYHFVKVMISIISLE